MKTKLLLIGFFTLLFILGLTLIQINSAGKTLAENSAPTNETRPPMDIGKRDEARKTTGVISGTINSDFLKKYSASQFIGKYPAVVYLDKVEGTFTPSTEP
ncbi:MAG: hypothetical protein AAB019_09810, partial [Planctomycetota bacterium]